MKKYFFEAEKIQWEKPNEPKHVCSAAAMTAVIAASEAEAQTLAEAKLEREYYGTGCLLGPVKLTGCAELPADWSYGYGAERRSGPTAQIGDLVGKNVIR